MKTYRLFASVYESVEEMNACRKRDVALDTHNVSDVFTANASTLQDAVECFFKSQEFADFLDVHHKAVPFYLDDENCPHIYE